MILVVLLLVSAATGGSWAVWRHQRQGQQTPTAPTAWPTSPPATICGDSAVLDGPETPPQGAVVVPPGDNSAVTIDMRQPGRTFWFAPGSHTLGPDEFSQIAPGDHTTFVGAPGAVIDGQRKNRYAFTQRATGVRIEHLTIRNFVAPLDEGTVNHDAGEQWTMRYLTVEDNGGAGVFLGSGNTASDNCLKDNGQYGFQGISTSGPGTDIVLDHNEIVGNNTGDWESKNGGCGCTGGGKFWDVSNVRVTNNWVHDNHSVGLWADTNNNNFLFEGNWIENNDGQAIFWEISYNAAIRNNVIRHNLVKTGPKRVAGDDNFPDAAIYVSESGGDARLRFDLAGSPTVDISANLIEDNYNGVALWENADRFCGSPANTSTGYCTLVNPKVATIKTCRAPAIRREPYYSDCRWKTQNVKVHDNVFRIDRSDVFGCPRTFCGRNALFSNWGTVPAWSPYQGEKVMQAITFEQGNTFSHNTYVGGWSFTAADASRLVPPSVWRDPPYSQDAGSSFTG